MDEKILVPVLGESITEATVSKWLKNEGDNVEADEPIVELETDKVNLEVPSPIDGVLSDINSKDGETVEVGALLGSISQNGVKPAEKKIITKNNITIIGYTDFPSRMAAQASTLYANNVRHMVDDLTPLRDGKVKVNMKDDVIRGVTVTHAGKITFPPPPPKGDYSGTGIDRGSR